MERKSLKDISWQVPESVYRADNALSYSTLARYEREGFNNLNKLFEKVESPSLTFGSVVDTLITGDEDEFNKLFMVAQMDNPPSDTLVIITKRLFDTYKGIYNNLRDIPEDSILNVIEDITWNNHWLPKTRVKKIKEDCAAYYKLLYLSEGKTIISSFVYQDALNTVDALKTSDATRFYFEEDNLFDNNIERLYQLKFKATFNNVDYRCMADLIIVLHDKEIVVPVDLKTSSKPEWDFHKSFLEWQYMIQSRLYWRIIRDNMDKDPYFKDFELADYRFIVANKKTLTPLVWLFKNTKTMGDIITKDNITMRDPFTIGEELNGYLINKPRVPNHIDLIKPNILEDWIL